MSFGTIEPCLPDNTPAPDLPLRMFPNPRLPNARARSHQSAASAVCRRIRGGFRDSPLVP
jgi:hypothetical protein